MATFIPEAVQEALDQARMHGLQKHSRLRVHADGAVYPVLRKWDGGFSISESDAGQLRGLVDLFDGSRHVAQCLIVASSIEHGEMCYEYKRSTPATGDAPVDFYRDPAAPVALIEDGSAVARN